MTTSSSPIAVQINLFPEERGIVVVPFSSYDAKERTAEEIGRFVIPWHELAGVIERMERTERFKLDGWPGA